MGSSQNELGKYVVLFLWMGVNIYLFVDTYYKLTTEKKDFYLRMLVGHGLAAARASAAVLNFNCMLILLTMCRNLLSFIRGCCSCGRSFARLLDKSITFHKYIAYMICLQTAVHVVAHVFNVQLFISSWQEGGISAVINQLEDVKNQTYLNPIRSDSTDPVTVVFTFAAGLTGAVITLNLILMISSSTELVRRSYFEVFWYSHHQFVIFYIGLVLHGIEGIVRFQSNVDQHDPEYCSTLPPEMWYKKCQTTPQFQPYGMNTWKWVVGPMALYFTERFIRFCRSYQRVKIIKVVKHPSKVIEIQMKKSGFRMEAGQYIFLMCPRISQFEWHPFTLTSAPEEDHFSVHIRIAGDWTGALAKEFGYDAKESTDLSSLPRLAVDGPFGTASTDVFSYSVCMCIGAGIGVTPFASVLKSIWHQYQQGNSNIKVKKVYFYWICPDTNAFEWFTDLLQDLEREMSNAGNVNFLEYNIYLTRGWGPNEARSIMLYEDENADIITGLQQKTRYGRPVWNQEFTDVARSHPDTKVGVFICGPKALSSALHKMCNIHSNSTTGAKFYFNKENF